MTFLNVSWISILCLILACVLYLLFSISALKRLEWGKEIIILMRVSILVLFSVAFLRMAVKKERVVDTKGKVALLVDTSGSVFLPSRESGAISEFIKRKEEILGDLRKKGFRVEIFSIDETVSPLTEDTLLKGDEETHIVDSLIEFIKRRKGELHGIILISDGYDHSIMKADTLKPLKFPINTVLMPFPKKKDIWVDKVNIPYLIFRKVPVKVEAEIKGIEVDGEHRYTIYLNGQPVRRGVIRVKNGEGRLAREIIVPQEGDFLIAVKVDKVKGELTHFNNMKVKKVKVVRDRIRTLQLVGTPTWDVRFLRRFLKKNRSVELISFIILRTPEDVLFFSEDELSLIPFPSREIFESALSTFDVVFFQNFNYAPYLGWNGIFYLARLKREIEKGLGFVMIGGDRSFLRGGYKKTPVESVLPVKVRIVKEPLIRGRFEVTLTEEGKKHPLTSFLKPYEDKIPPLIDINVDIEPKKNALVLLREKKNDYPIIVVGNYGEGRICVIATDSLWRWYFTAKGEKGIDLYTPLMERILYWAGQDYTFSEVTVREEEDSTVVEVKDRTLKPCIGCTVELAAESPDGRIISEKEVKTDDEGVIILSNDFATTPYVLNVKPERRLEEFHFGIMAKDRKEYSELYKSHSSLEEIANITGGVFLRIEDFDPEEIVLKGNMKGKEEIIAEIWDTPLFILILFVIMLSEWAFRRRWGLE